MGRVYHHLYPQVYDWDNLIRAWRKARKGKRGQPPAAAFETNVDWNLIELQLDLQEQRYQPGRYTSFTIREPKRRLISAAPFRDRVVHHALCNVIEPIFERHFIHDSYANRVGKGTHAALDRCQYLARQNRYVLQCDVEQFFPAIDHSQPDVVVPVPRVVPVAGRRTSPARAKYTTKQGLLSCQTRTLNHLTRALTKPNPPPKTTWSPPTTASPSTARPSPTPSPPAPSC